MSDPHSFWRVRFNVNTGKFTAYRMECDDAEFQMVMTDAIGYNSSEHVYHIDIMEPKDLPKAKRRLVNMAIQMMRFDRRMILARMREVQKVKDELNKEEK